MRLRRTGLAAALLAPAVCAAPGPAQIAFAADAQESPLPTPVERYQGQLHANFATINTTVLVGGIRQTLECDACLGILRALKGIAAVGGASAVQTSLRLVCDKFAVSTPEVCQGLADLQGGPITYMVQNMDVASDGPLWCYSLFALQLCPKPALPSITVSFPKPKPAVVSTPSASGQLLNVAHLSDIHVDAQYVAGSEAQCDTFLCCRGFNDSATTVTRAASPWGDYNCDAPPLLINNLLSSLPNISGAPDFAILTGDIDPHNLWSDDEQYSSDNLPAAYAEIRARMGDVPLYPNIGNHDAGPANQFDLPSEDSPLKISYLYSLLSDAWQPWLPARAQAQVADSGHGSYSVLVGENSTLRLISLNTNLAYSLNFYLYPRANDTDPAGVLSFLINELQAAEDAGQAAWIISHVATSGSDALEGFANAFLQVVRRYSETIKFIAAAHTHRDEFNIFYGTTSAPSEATADDAIAFALWAPSQTPNANLNPGWRTYMVDAGSWEIMDSQTYIANLDQVDTWGSAGPNWHFEYSAREYVPGWPADAPLNATFWHLATENFASNGTMFDRFFLHRSKSSGLDGICAAGEQCQTDIISNLRTGESGLWTKSSSTHGLVTYERLLDLDGRHPTSGQHWQAALCSPHAA